MANLILEYGIYDNSGQEVSNKFIFEFNSELDDSLHLIAFVTYNNLIELPKICICMLITEVILEKYQSH